MFRAAIVSTLLLLAGATSAREGDLDTRFNSVGMQVRKFDENGSASKYDAATRVVRDALGRYALIGYVDPGEVGIAYLSSNGSFLYGSTLEYPGLIEVMGATMDTHGRIVVVGNSLVQNDINPVVCRFGPTGVPDSTLGPQGCRTYPINKIANGYDATRAVATDAVDNIYVVGVTQFAAEDYDFLVMKLDAFANPISGFGTNGIKLVAFDIDAAHAGGDADEALTVLLQPPYLYVGGMAAGEQGFDFALTKLSTLTGDYDSNFCASASPCSGSAVASAGKRTMSFDSGGTNADWITGLAAMSDGSIIVAGNVASSQGATDYLVTKLDTTGHFPIASFGGNGHYARDAISGDTRVSSVLVRADDSILIAGTTSALTSPNKSLWVRQLTASGVLVPDFTSTQFNPIDTTLITFTNWNNSLPIDHVAGSLTEDRGYILLAGARLWRRDTPNGVNDFDYAVVRLKGDVLFRDSFEF